MKKFASANFRVFLWIGIVVLLLVAARSFAAQSPAADSKKQAVHSPVANPIDPSQYLGEETCKTCHADLPHKDFVKNYESSPHYATTMDTKKGPEWHGCEACHGPGKEHVDSGGGKTKIFTFKNASAKEISARCLTCHEYGEEHSNFGRSPHLQNNVGCTDCHDPHNPKENQFLMKEKQPQLCYGCHPSKQNSSSIGRSITASTKASSSAATATTHMADS
jgi:DmsE family decaheme c-type cytochrome